MSHCKRNLILGFLAGCLLFLAAACSTPAPRRASGKDQVDEALKRYTGFVLHKDVEGIAAMFAPDGEVVNPGQAPIRGREAIRQFLAAFSGYTVLSDETTPTTTVVHRDSAVQHGRFSQRVRTPSGQELEVRGSFVAHWVRTPGGEWLLQSMATVPQGK